MRFAELILIQRITEVQIDDRVDFCAEVFEGGWTGLPLIYTDGSTVQVDQYGRLWRIPISPNAWYVVPLGCILTAIWSW